MMSDDKTTENRLIFGVPSLSIAIGVWWYVWGLYGFWWGGVLWILLARLDRIQTRTVFTQVRSQKHSTFRVETPSADTMKLRRRRIKDVTVHQGHKFPAVSSQHKLFNFEHIKTSNLPS